MLSELLSPTTLDIWVRLTRLVSVDVSLAGYGPFVFSTIVLKLRFLVAKMPLRCPQSGLNCARRRPGTVPDCDVSRLYSP